RSTRWTRSRCQLVRATRATCARRGTPTRTCPTTRARSLARTPPRRSPDGTILEGGAGARRAPGDWVGRSGWPIDDGPGRFQGGAEPAGERCSQPDDGGVGRFVDGCGPGDVGVRADQEGVGRPVIGL